MPSIEWNRRVWDREHPWTRHGDEWDEQASFCQQPYERWKASLIDTFIRPHVSSTSVVLEIAPGHGRWTEHIVRLAREVILVDMSPSCIAFCAEKFQGSRNIRHYTNDGFRLGPLGNASVDFIWSYDSFVHMERDVIASYLREFSRVLKAGGTAVIHHPGRRDTTLWLWSFLRPFGPPGRRLYTRISIGKADGYDGERSNVSREFVARAAKRSGLTVQSQVDSWGTRGEFNVKLYRDCVSALQRPVSTEVMHGPMR